MMAVRSPLHAQVPHTQPALVSVHPSAFRVFGVMVSLHSVQVREVMSIFSENRRPPDLNRDPLPYEGRAIDLFC